MYNIILINKAVGRTAVKDESKFNNGSKADGATGAKEPEISDKKLGKNMTSTVKKLCKRWFIDAFSGMAQGLFVTLIAGTIIKQIGIIIGANFVGNFLVLLGQIASIMMGAGIGAGIALYLKAPKMVVLASIVAGFVGAFSPQVLSADFSGGTLADITQKLTICSPGNPISAYICSILAVELGTLVCGKTKLDILVVPFTCIMAAYIGVYVSYPFIWLVDQLGVGIAIATNFTPFFMGIIIAVIMGVLLTMPTSSAAIWISVAAPIMTGFADGRVSEVAYNAMLLAGGAAAAGCCAHMVGFAVSSFRENRWSGLVSQGLGTSMLQIPNIMKKPIIMLPMIIASAVCGPLATCVFGLRCSATGGGMGTAGLVGVFETITTSTASGLSTWSLVAGVALVYFVLPALISLGITELLRKTGKIKLGDYSLNYDK